MRESARPVSEPPLPSETVCSSVPFPDGGLRKQTMSEEIRSVFRRLFDEQDGSPGEETEALESEFAEFCDSHYAVACASGADAVALSLMALDIGPGDEIITSPFAPFTAVGAICRLGARPVLADIDPVSFTLSAQKVEDCITPRTRAIIPVHLFGQCTDMEPLFRIAVRKRLAIVEEASDALGAEYHGRRAGVLGTLACFRFIPVAHHPDTAGGGIITTDDAELASRLRRLRIQGETGDGTFLEIGLDSRLNDLQAALWRIHLKHLAERTGARQDQARRYRELFRLYELLDVVELPETLSGRQHIYQQFCIRIRGGQRDTVLHHLRKQNFDVAVPVAVPLSLQPACAVLGYSPGDFPEAEQACAEVLALPIEPPLEAVQQENCVRAIAAALGRATEIPSPRQNFLASAFPPQRAA